MFSLKYAYTFQTIQDIIHDNLKCFDLIKLKDGTTSNIYLNCKGFVKTYISIYLDYYLLLLLIFKFLIVLSQKIKNFAKYNFCRAYKCIEFD